MSGGELQRIRLATQIGTQLVNVLYILDEPSIGLHQRDNSRLIKSLKNNKAVIPSIISKDSIKYKVKNQFFNLNYLVSVFYNAN